MSSKKYLETKLQKIGLSKQEAVVYLACLNHPKTTPSKLSEITNIKRTSLYPILNNLSKNHLIYKKTFLKKKYIYAHPPKHAMDSVISTSQEKNDHITKTAKSLVDKLQLSVEEQSYKTNTGALFLSGKPGIQELIGRVLNEKQNIYWIGPSKMFIGLDKEYQRDLFQKLSVKRMENGTTAFAITDEKFKSSFYFHGGSRNFRQLRILDLPDSLNTMIVVTGNLCCFIKSLESKSEAVIFENDDYAEIMRFTLKILWHNLKE